MSKTTLASAFGWILVVGGALLTAWALVTVRDARASQDWPSVTGRVTAARVERSVGRSTSRTREYRYRARVTYDYVVDGESFPGERVSFLTDYYDSAEEARETVERYAPGSDVAVYYKPGHPAEAVLESNYGSGTYLPLGLSVFMFVVGGLVVRGSRRQAQQEQPRTPI